MRKTITKKCLQLITTAGKLFKEHGFKNISVEQICSESKVSKMTFYKNFKNKNDLILYILTEIFERGFLEVDRIYAENISFEEKMIQLFTWKQNFIKEWGDKFILDYMHALPDLKLLLEDYYTKSHQLFLALIIESQKKGEVRPEIRPEFILKMLDLFQVVAQDDDLIKYYNKYNDFLAEINNFFFYGIIAGKGKNN